jgi:pimeloyl-ACP methyl ester carboxylesterase
MAGDVAALATRLGFDRFRVAGEDWGAAIGYAVAAFYRPRVQQLVFQQTLLPGLPAGERDPSLAPDDGRTGWHWGTRYPGSWRRWPPTSGAPSSPSLATTSRWRTRSPWPGPTSTSLPAADPLLTRS